ncbi:MAG: TIGR02647 family protein [Sulfuritalea sp.]|nr:TIGR02647 family protein [Sulfuritalea sp.]
MPYTPDLVHELNTLIRFDLETSQQGIKVHKNADPEVIAATARLHAKGMLTLVDGGYLTALGREAAEHAQATLTLLTAGDAAIACREAGSETQLQQEPA